MSVDKYEEFSLKKSISACVIAKSKLKKELKPAKARIICEKEISTGAGRGGSMHWQGTGAH